MSAPRIGLVGAVRVVAAVAARPHLWRTAVRQMRRTARPRWWRHRPFLPVPTGEYLHFRLVTQYGETGDPPAPHDVVDYLAWCREWERSLG